MSVLKVKQNYLKITRNYDIDKAITAYKANNLWDNEKKLVSEMFSLYIQKSLISTKLQFQLNQYI
jgi:hypothetical protein